MILNEQEFYKALYNFTELTGIKPYPKEQGRRVYTALKIRELNNNQVKNALDRVAGWNTQPRNIFGAIMRAHEIIRDEKFNTPAEKKQIFHEAKTPEEKANKNLCFLHYQMLIALWRAAKLKPHGFCKSIMGEKGKVIPGTWDAECQAVRHSDLTELEKIKAYTLITQKYLAKLEPAPF